MGPIERFVAASLRQRLFVLICLAAFVLTGVMAFRGLPVEAFPDLTNNQVVVVTEAPGLAANEVEQRVTYPVETALMGVPDAQEVRSISKQGLSLVTLVFDDGVPVYLARQLVAERIADVHGQPFNRWMVNGKNWPDVDPNPREKGQALSDCAEERHGRRPSYPSPSPSVRRGEDC